MGRAGVVAVALFMSEAHAFADDAEPVHLVYRAPVGCPGEADLEAAIQARTALFRRAAAATGTRAFEIEVSASGAGFEGTLRVVEPDGSSTTRTVASERCEDVVQAIGFVAALAVDPAATAAPRETPQLQPAPVTPPAPAPVARVEPPGEGNWTLAFGAHLGLSSGMAPSALPVVALFADVRGPWALAGSSSLRLGFVYAAQDVPVAGAGSAELAWMLGRADLCPASFGGAITFEPCARFDVGALTATGVEVANAQREQRLWLAAGAVGRARWQVSGAIAFELEASVAAPLLRDRFYFAPDTTVHRASPVSLAVAAGVAVSIP